MVNHSMLQKRVESCCLPWWILVKVICESLNCDVSNLNLSAVTVEWPCPCHPMPSVLQAWHANLRSMIAEIQSDQPEPLRAFQSNCSHMLTYVEKFWWKGLMWPFLAERIRLFFEPVDICRLGRRGQTQCTQCSLRCSMCCTAHCALRLSPFVHR